MMTPSCRSVQMAEQEVRREMEDERQVEDVLGDINTDNENDQEDYESWKVRELKRIKRDREERERWGVFFSGWVMNVS